MKIRTKKIWKAFEKYDLRLQRIPSNDRINPLEWECKSAVSGRVTHANTPGVAVEFWLELYGCSSEPDLS